ncbi:hypothetical protein D9757_000774 [Collybiopsis confluens]|uniref:Uncharacterized protein n=1 Tax=Collybiopsis confluens TaxID=2823264 RepID=A0A8H5MGC8_9AGAR|nr:hypothetical protein D9757_000774 [Collybiopsis confluens]
MRCTHGQRDCTWPDGAPTRKKSSVRKDSLDADGRPSTAGSSISEGSTPPTRHPTPPRIQPLELDLPPLASRRMPSGDRFAYTHPPGPSHLSSLPETDPYISQHRYDHPYIAHPSTRPIAGPGMRSGAEHVPHPVQWHVPVLAPAHVDTYEHGWWFQTILTNSSTIDTNNSHS